MIQEWRVPVPAPPELGRGGRGDAIIQYSTI